MDSSRWLSLHLLRQRYGVNGHKVLKTTLRINIQELFLFISKYAFLSDNLLVLFNNRIELSRSIIYGMEDMKILGVIKLQSFRALRVTLNITLHCVQGLPPLHTVIRFYALAQHAIMLRSQHWYTIAHAIYIVFFSSKSIICVTWRWPLAAETCSYLVDIIYNNY